MYSDKKATQKVVYVANRSVSPMFLLALLFIGLKLTGYITWPWYWVVAPLWAPFALAYGFVAGTLMVMGMIALFAGVIGVWLNRRG